MSYPNMRAKDALTAFLNARRAEGLRPKTVVWYSRMIAPYLKFVELEGGSWDSAGSVRMWMRLSQEDDLRYADHPKREPQCRPLSPATLRAHHRALTAWFNWLVEEGLLQESPMKRIKAPKEGKHAPKTVDTGDFVRILAACHHPRDRALVMFLADTGVRDAEARTLTVDRLDLAQRTALVRGKGNKERLAFYTEATAKALAAWLLVKPKRWPQVFPGERGPMGPSAIYQLLRRAARRAGVRGRFNPHAWRHYFASEYVRTGGDLETLRQLLGHEDLETTRRYLHFQTEDLRRKHDRHSPVSIHLSSQED